MSQRVLFVTIKLLQYVFNYYIFAIKLFNYYSFAIKQMIGALLSF